MTASKNFRAIGFEEFFYFYPVLLYGFKRTLKPYLKLGFSECKQMNPVYIFAYNEHSMQKLNKPAHKSILLSCVKNVIRT